MSDCSRRAWNAPKWDGVEFRQLEMVEMENETCEIKDTTHPTNDDVWTTALCSACGAEYTIDFKYLNYCPNCGARVVSA